MKLKVICLNLWQGGLLFDEILEFLKQEDADILLLQEVYNGKADDGIDIPGNYRSIEMLRQALPAYTHYDYAPAIRDIVPEGKFDNGNAVFAKYTITPKPTVFFNEPYGERDAFDPKGFPTTPRNLQHVTVNVNGTELNIFNFQGVWDLNGDNYSSQRQRMSEVIIEAVKGKPHVILAGDTNAKPTNLAMRAIQEHLHSVFGDELATSFNMRRKDNPGYATACVDMIFVSSDIAVSGKSCPDVDISDHLPLIAELTI